MEGFLKTLNDNAGAFQVVFAALVTLATVVYAALTWILVAETRRMRRAQTDAKVVIGLEVRPQYVGFVDVCVRNEGVGPAYDVSFAVRPTVTGQGDASVVETIASLGFIARGIDYFSPNQEFRSFLTSVSDNYDVKMATSITVDVGYKTAAGEAIRDTYVLDFSMFHNITQLGKPDLYSIAKSLEKLQDDVHKISTGRSKPHVLTQDRNQYEDERRRDYEERIAARRDRDEKSEPDGGET